MADGFDNDASFPSGEPGVPPGAPGLSSVAAGLRAGRLVAAGEYSTQLSSVPLMTGASGPACAHAGGPQLSNCPRVPTSPRPHVPTSPRPHAGTWLPIGTLAPACGLTDRHLRRLALRLRKAGQARLVAGRWELHRDAQVRGRSAHAWLGTGADVVAASTASGLPPGHAQWTDADRQRYLDTRTLLDWWTQFQADYRGPRDGACAAFAASPAPHAGLTTDHSRLMTVAHWATTRGLRITPRTLRQYRARLTRDGNVDRRGRGAKAAAASCTPDAWEFFKVHYLTNRQPSVRLCWELTRAEARRQTWRWPTIRTIERRVEAELPPPIADYYRLGPQAWERKHGPRIQRDMADIRPNERWVGDHALLDLLCTDGGGRYFRPWLTAWQDQRSRLIVGWVLSRRPNSQTILAAFRRGVLTHGAPAGIIVDNGKDYRAAGFSGGRARKIDDTKSAASVCTQLDIEVSFCEPFNPGSKCIESWFGSLHERFDKLFESYCGRCPAERPEDLFKRLRAGDVVVPTLDELEVALVSYIDAFHARPHSGEGMEGLCPRDAFAQLDPLPRRTAPTDVLDLLVRQTVRIKVGKHGVRHGGVQYGQGALALFPLIGQVVQLRLDPDSADYVDVEDLEGRLIVRAYQQRLRGHSHEDIAEARRRRKKARMLVKALRGAWHDAERSVVDLAIEAQAEQAEELRKAAGAENLSPPPRDVRLLPSAAQLSPPRPIAPEPAWRHPLDDLPLELADDADDAPVCPLDAAPDLEPCDEPADTDSPLDDDFSALSAEPDDVACALDELPMPAAADQDEWVHPLDAWPA